MKRIILYSAILAAAIAAFSCGRKNQTDNNSSSLFVLSDTLEQRLKLATAVNEDVRGKLQLTGKVSAYEDMLVKVSPLVDGVIEKINVNLGDYITKGQVMAVIQSADVADVEDQIEQAEAVLASAKKNYDVTQDQARLGLAAPKDVMLAANEVKKADADLRKARQVSGLYGVKNSLYTLKAPINGYVIDKNPSISNQMSYHTANIDPFFTLADLNQVQIWADVFEADIDKIKIGEAVTIKVLALPGKDIMGKIDKVQDMINPQTRTMKVRVSVPNSNIALKPDMFAEVSVSYDDSLKMVSIPSDALIFDSNKYYVVIYKSKTDVSIREVKVYDTEGSKSFIQQGLKVGEQVMISDQLVVFNALSN